MHMEVFVPVQPTPNLRMLVRASQSSMCRSRRNGTAAHNSGRNKNTDGEKEHAARFGDGCEVFKDLSVREKSVLISYEDEIAGGVKAEWFVDHVGRHEVNWIWPVEDTVRIGCRRKRVCAKDFARPVAGSVRDVGAADRRGNGGSAWRPIVIDEPRIGRGKIRKHPVCPGLVASVTGATRADGRRRTVEERDYNCAGRSDSQWISSVVGRAEIVKRVRVGWCCRRNGEQNNCDSDEPEP